jgi:hypothetical protein
MKITIDVITSALNEEECLPELFRRWMTLQIMSNVMFFDLLS